MNLLEAAEALLESLYDHRITVISKAGQMELSAVGTVELDALREEVKKARDYEHEQLQEAER